jgi:hypothetical protein
MPCEDPTPPEEQTQQGRWERSEATQRLYGFEVKAVEGYSQRDFARESGTPRSTLQGWLARKRGLELAPEVGAFLESPAGLAFGQRVVEAARLVFTQMGPGGIRPMCLFLELSQLDRIVASSYGVQHKASAAMQSQIVEYGKQQRSSLASSMPQRSISLCEDETFHPQTCLVAIEPLSGFIVLERYSQQRDEKSWTAAMAEATADLRVEIVQAVSDEAKGLLAHAREGLGVHHGPDLFHVQHDLGRATALCLASAERQAAEELEKARMQVAKHVEQRDAYWSAPRGPGHPPLFEKRIFEAQEAQQRAEAALQESQQRRSEAKEAMRAIGELYHPFQLSDGQSRSPQQLRRELEEQFGRIEQVATAAALSQASHQRIAKARRLIPSMVATLSFFFLRLHLLLRSLHLPSRPEALVRHGLVPGLYLQRIAEQAPSAERRTQLRQRAEELLSKARAPDAALKALPEQRQRLVEQTAEHCAELFQRSSSCVEGRNGQLSLHHHSLHRLSGRKLTVLTILHNYFIRRRDGTTAAERFFGSPPADLFEWILPRLPLPARPARPRSARRPRAA